MLIILEQNHSSALVLLNTLWYTWCDLRSQLVLWLSFAWKSQCSSLNVSEFPELPKVCEKRPGRFERDIQSRFSRNDILASIEPNNVYCFLLYCDEFHSKRPLFPKGSDAGSFTFPLRLKLCWRRYSFYNLRISFMPPRISTSQLLHALISDIVNSTHNWS